MLYMMKAFRAIKPAAIVPKSTKGQSSSDIVLKVITDAKSITAPGIMKTNEMLSGTVYRILRKLEDEKLIVRSAKSATAGNPVYFSLAG